MIILADLRENFKHYKCEKIVAIDIINGTIIFGYFLKICQEIGYKEVEVQKKYCWSYIPRVYLKLFSF